MLDPLENEMAHLKGQYISSLLLLHIPQQCVVLWSCAREQERLNTNPTAADDTIVPFDVPYDETHSKFEVIPSTLVVFQPNKQTKNVNI